MGQVEFGEFSSEEMDGLQVHYAFVAGEDWGLVAEENNKEEDSGDGNGG